MNQNNPDPTSADLIYDLLFIRATQEQVLAFFSYHVLKNGVVHT